MIVYRITTGIYAKDISGEGARLAGGRWNTAGLSVLYTSQHISLSILEILVKADKITAPDNYTIVTIEFPDDKNFSVINLSELKLNWQNHLAYTQWIGDQFIKNNEHLVLKIPSAIVPQEHNFLINPLHKDFKKVKIVGNELLELDKRLLQTE